MNVASRRTSWVPTSSEGPGSAAKSRQTGGHRRLAPSTEDDGTGLLRPAIAGRPGSAQRDASPPWLLCLVRGYILPIARICISFHENDILLVVRRNISDTQNNIANPVAG